jgi:hypothetical protein
MNEPQNVSNEILSLMLLAKTDNIFQTVQPTDFKHDPRSSDTLWPVAPFSSLTFGTAIPKGQCWLVTYVSMYTCADNESSSNIDFGLNWFVPTFWQWQQGTEFRQVTSAVLSVNIFNAPCMLVFPEGVIPRIIIAPNSSTQTSGSRIVLARANAYLLPSALFGVFDRYRTSFEGI